LFCSIISDAQDSTNAKQISTPSTLLTLIEFHVDGMNTEAAKTTVINSINNFPGKIISWTPDISNETILVGFTKNERAIDILELIASTGYKPWYINQNGMKVVLVGTNKTEEHYIKP